MPSVRQIRQGVQVQGEDESLVWSFDFGPWLAASGISTASAAAKKYETLAGAGSILSGSPTISGCRVLHRIATVTAGSRYRVEVGITDTDSNIWEGFMVLDGET